MGDIMNFPKRLKFLREQKGLTQEELASILNISRSALSLWEIGKREPNQETLRLFAEYFGVSIDYLLGRTDNPRPLDDISRFIPGAYPVGKMVKLPVLGVIRAGEPILAVENIIGWEEVPEEEIRDGEYFFLRVTGDSMKDAHIPDGSFVLVRKQDYVDDGRIAVVLVNNEEATVKKIKYVNGKVMLLPANPTYEPQIYNMDEVQIIGKVVEIKIKVD